MKRRIDWARIGAYLVGAYLIGLSMADAGWKTRPDGSRYFCPCFPPSSTCSCQCAVLRVTLSNTDFFCWMQPGVAPSRAITYDGVDQDFFVTNSAASPCVYWNDNVGITIITVYPVGDACTVPLTPAEAALYGETQNRTNTVLARVTLCQTNGFPGGGGRNTELWGGTRTFFGSPWYFSGNVTGSTSVVYSQPKQMTSNGILTWSQATCCLTNPAPCGYYLDEGECLYVYDLDAPPCGHYWDTSLCEMVYDPPEAIECGYHYDTNTCNFALTNCPPEAPEWNQTTCECAPEPSMLMLAAIGAALMLKVRQ